jgi:hypothetical protein
VIQSTKTSEKWWPVYFPTKFHCRSDYKSPGRPLISQGVSVAIFFSLAGSPPYRAQKRHRLWATLSQGMESHRSSRPPVPQVVKPQMAFRWSRPGSKSCLASYSVNDREIVRLTRPLAVKPLLPPAVGRSVANKLCGGRSITWPEQEGANMPTAFIFLSPFHECAVAQRTMDWNR